MPVPTKYFFFAAELLIFAGIIYWLFGDKLKWSLIYSGGKLPGDIRLENEGGGFYFPIVTCIPASVALSWIVWLSGIFP